ncbi:hypothetical protein RLIN73S_03768 [Rhodanobacter lindaniclasticus]
MKAPTLRRICAHSGSSFGSNTTHWVPRYRLSTYSASRRTGTYLYSSASRSAPRSVREPHATGPTSGKLRRQFTPSGLSMPFSASLSGTAKPCTPFSAASMPAGAFHTPRWVSVRAITPATMPQGTKVSSWPWRFGSDSITRGKYSAALRAATPLRPSAVSAALLALVMLPALDQVAPGGSTMSNARRSTQKAIAVWYTWGRMSPSAQVRRDAQQVEQIDFLQRIDAGLGIRIAFVVPRRIELGAVDGLARRDHAEPLVLVRIRIERRRHRVGRKRRRERGGYAHQRRARLEHAIDPPRAFLHAQVEKGLLRAAGAVAHGEVEQVGLGQAVERGHLGRSVGVDADAQRVAPAAGGLQRQLVVGDLRLGVLALGGLMPRRSVVARRTFSPGSRVVV